MARFVTSRTSVPADLPHTTGRASTTTISRMRNRSGGRSSRRVSKSRAVETDSALSQVSRNRSQTTTAIVRGSKNKTGDLIVSNGVGTTQVVEYDGPDSPQIGYSTTVSRSSRSQGGRRVSVSRITRRTAASPGQGLTQTEGFTANTEGCDPNPNPPEPEEEPLEPEPNPPQPDPEPVNQDQPQPSPEPTQPVGCGPGEPAQWFFNECPPGTSEIGFADLADGSNMRLCLGPEGRTPTGEGCPVEPDTYGYSPVDGQCVLVPNGLYSSQQACEDSLPGEDEEDQVPVGPGLLEYEFYDVNINDFAPAPSKQVVSPFTIERRDTRTGSPCAGSSVCCIFAVWEGGETSLTATQFFGNCGIINVRNLVFTLGA